MLFNSSIFLLFFTLVFYLYWFVLKGSIKKQNLFLLFASYVFYGWWDYRFLSLILFSTLVDYGIGRALFRVNKTNHRKLLLGLSLVTNLGLLCFFKYYNFFVESWVETWSCVGVTMHASTMQIVLPVGISFYTFQTLSYTIDIYRKKLQPTNDFIEFAGFVSFFPQLVAGPIERASHLLPQFARARVFDYDRAVSGFQLLVWGLFKKVVIADTCATYVDVIFDDYQSMNTTSLVLGSVYFAFQIYGDFSGYSDMAIGLSRLLGFDLMRNFNFPYFSRDIAEFWRRWHISLSTWFRDYLYIPLGGSRVNISRQVFNVMVVFLVSGFWHGANWTFIAWGALHALYFLPLLLLRLNRKNRGGVEASFSVTHLKELFGILITFILTTIAWVFFRAPTVQEAFDYLSRMVSMEGYAFEFLTIDRYSFEALLLIIPFVVFEWIFRNQEQPLSGKYSTVKIAVVTVALLLFGVFSNHKDFIYFQF